MANTNEEVNAGAVEVAVARPTVGGKSLPGTRRAPTGTAAVAALARRQAKAQAARQAVAEQGDGNASTSDDEHEPSVAYEKKLTKVMAAKRKAAAGAKSKPKPKAASGLKKKAPAVKKVTKAKAKDMIGKMIDDPHTEVKKLVCSVMQRYANDVAEGALEGAEKLLPHMRGLMSMFSFDCLPRE